MMQGVVLAAQTCIREENQTHLDVAVAYAQEDASNFAITLWYKPRPTKGCMKKAIHSLLYKGPQEVNYDAGDPSSLVLAHVLPGGACTASGW